MKSTLTGYRRRKKLFTVLWVAALTILTFALIYWEQTAVLYILATLGVTALLLVVAFSDLNPAGRFTNDSGRMDDSAAIGSGISSTFGSKRA